MFCPKCGSEVKDGDMFCGECGMRMEPLESENQQTESQKTADQNETQNQDQYSRIKHQIKHRQRAEDYLKDLAAKPRRSSLLKLQY
jgi:uncharacterized Zn finger protein (UPF0148 family)